MQNKPSSPPPQPRHLTFVSSRPYSDKWKFHGSERDAVTAVKYGWNTRRAVGQAYVWEDEQWKCFFEIKGEE